MTAKEKIKELVKQKIIKWYPYTTIEKFVEGNVPESEWVDRIIALSKINSNARTKERMILSYGEKLGQEKWESYCKKQSITNTFEYKSKKYGWTQERFENYNKSRSVTLENCIKRHGIDEGKKIFDNYCKKQSIAGTSLEYFVDKYGIDEGTKKYKSVNKSKAITLENCIKRHGIDEGPKKHKKWLNSIRENLQSCKSGYSKISQELFWEIYNRLPENRKSFCKFAELNYEYSVPFKKTFKFYDFVLLDKNICIEFNGDLYHMNPEKYDKTDKFKIWGTLFEAEKVWDADKEKVNHLQKKGFRVIIIWESEYKRNKQKIIENILNEI